MVIPEKNHLGSQWFQCRQKAPVHGHAFLLLGCFVSVGKGVDVLPPFSAKGTHHPNTRFSLHEKNKAARVLALTGHFLTV